MSPALVIGSTIFWAIAYVLIIRRSLADRSYGMPIVALCCNLAWEFIFAAVRPPADPFQHAMAMIWLVIDFGLLYVTLRFGPREFPGIPRRIFYGGFLLTFVLAYFGTDLVDREFDEGAGTYVVFELQMMMSALFVAMLVARRSLRGQSVSIAIAKLIGSSLAAVWTLLYGTHETCGGRACDKKSALLMYFYVASFILDVVYLIGVIALQRRVRNGLSGDRSDATTPHGVSEEDAVPQA